VFIPEMIKQIAEGLSSEEIAERLVIRKKTVDRHRATSSRSSACATALS
jgi:FixJ family two-component response regulator